MGGSDLATHPRQFNRLRRSKWKPKSQTPHLKPHISTRCWRSTTQRRRPKRRGKTARTQKPSACGPKRKRPGHRKPARGSRITSGENWSLNYWTGHRQLFIHPSIFISQLGSHIFLWRLIIKAASVGSKASIAISGCPFVLNSRSDNSSPRRTISRSEG